MSLGEVTKEILSLSLGDPEEKETTHYAIIGREGEKVEINKKVLSETSRLYREMKEMDPNETVFYFLQSESGGLPLRVFNLLNTNGNLDRLSYNSRPEEIKKILNYINYFGYPKERYLSSVVSLLRHLDVRDLHVLEDHMRLSSDPEKFLSKISCGPAVELGRSLFDTKVDLVYNTLKTAIQEGKGSNPRYYLYRGTFNSIDNLIPKLLRDLEVSSRRRDSRITRDDRDLRWMMFCREFVDCYSYYLIFLLKMDYNLDELIDIIRVIYNSTDNIQVQQEFYKEVYFHYLRKAYKIPYVHPSHPDFRKYKEMSDKLLKRYERCLLTPKGEEWDRLLEGPDAPRRVTKE